MRIATLLSSDDRRRSSIAPTATVAEAALKMTEPHLRALLVVDGERAVGIITRRDLFERVIAHHLPSATPLAQVMSSNPITAPAELAIEDAIALMNRHHIRHLAVVNADGSACGVIGIELLADWLAADREAQIEELVQYITHG